MTDHALLLCDDLIFVSRITGTAKALGLSVRTSKSPAEILGLCKQSPPPCVIIDLQAPGLTIADFAAETNALTPRPLLVGYGSHVDTATLKKARDAGCDIVWPRSKFAEELANVLSEWCVRKAP